MHIVQSAVAKKGLLKGTKLSAGWWKRFLQRQPDLSLWCGDSTAHVRMDAVNANTIKHYLTYLTGADPAFCKNTQLRSS